MTLKPFTKFCCDFDCFDRMIILLKVDKETKIRLQIGDWYPEYKPLLHKRIHFVCLKNFTGPCCTFAICSRRQIIHPSQLNRTLFSWCSWKWSRHLWFSKLFGTKYWQGLLVTLGNVLLVLHLTNTVHAKFVELALPAAGLLKLFCSATPFLKSF